MGKLDLSLTPQELEAYVAGQRTVRLASADEDCTPHVVPLWYVWHEGAMYLNSTLGNLTVENVLRTGKATGVVDDGETYAVLRGVTLTGRVERLPDPAPEEVERKWSEKYLGGGEVPFGRWRNRCWLRLTPDRVASWDFRKIPAARAERKRGEGAREP